jgi:hypothetical protein
MNGFGNLRWNIETPSTSSTSLDLTITINEGKIHTTTYQKPLNLYLYIPPLSAHPHSCIKGLITGEILWYWNQNSTPEELIDITTLFIQCLINRGHTIQNLIPILLTAASTIDNHLSTSKLDKTTDSDDTIYIHWEHHPTDISKNTARRVYNNNLKNIDNFSNIRISTTSCPKNLRDILCKTELKSTEGNNISNILTQILSQTNNDAAGTTQQIQNPWQVHIRNIY